MRSKVLTYYELHSIGQVYAWTDLYTTLFGLEPVLIDWTGTMKYHGPGHFPIVFRSLQEAELALSDHTWIWFHPEGKISLSELKYPKGPAVYAIGSAAEGFEESVDSLEKRGQTVRLDLGVMHGHHILPLILYDRYLRKV